MRQWGGRRSAARPNVPLRRGPPVDRAGGRRGRPGLLRRVGRLAAWMAIAASLGWGNARATHRNRIRIRRARGRFPLRTEGCGAHIRGTPFGRPDDRHAHARHRAALAIRVSSTDAEYGMRWNSIIVGAKYRIVHARTAMCAANRTASQFRTSGIFQQSTSARMNVTSCRL